MPTVTGQHSVRSADQEPTDLLSKRIADELRDRIVTEEFPAGSRIKERALATEMNVSRTPLREALKILAADGLVVLLPNRGAVVANPTSSEIQERLDLLSALEAFAGEHAAEQATDDEITEIRAMTHEMLAAFERRDRRTYFHLNQRIHLAIVAAARNGALLSIYVQLNHQLYSYRFRSSGNLDWWQNAIAEHAKVVEALTARDSALLSSLLRHHVGSTWRQLGEQPRQQR